ncbi:acetylcholine receptor subunit alpha-like isoform X4 [Drosophila persimilis]|uniref:acetylcholine receptor subunit alpha-like isoform X4 n=1 Tax=Drosophila persimilis TaxID=7234 RepID=UPI000F085863|nr:acetylcholine receptor subunit alpha-like isoform X4 [Drosophila persimilis]
MKLIIKIIRLFIMRPTSGETLRAWIFSALMVHGAVAGNPDAKRLYDDLLSNYNKLVRPVVNTTDVLKVCIKLKLSQLIDVNLKNQIMTTNLWVEQVDLRHMDEQLGSNVVDVGVDLSEFYMSVEWDILEVPAVRNEKFYTCCDEPYLDITFNITMRRKTLFYTVNIIIPCMGISFLTVLTFYLPSDSGEKVTLSISILISLHVFFLLVVEIIPPTSLVVPLLGKYLIFAMILVSISICVTVVVLNVHFRSPQTHRMAPWVKRVFIDFLPKFLFIKRPTYNFETSKLLLKETHACFYPYYSSTNIDRLVSSRYTHTQSKEELSQSLTANGPFGGSCQVHGPLPTLTNCSSDDLAAVPDLDIGSSGIKSPILNNPAFSHSKCPPRIHKSCFCVRFIAEHTKMQEDSTKVKEDWKYVAMVLDRLFLWIFTLAVLAGTAGIILQAPTLYDDRIPIIEQKDLDFSGTSAGRCRPPQ